jgi:hypothetical protein
MAAATEVAEVATAAAVAATAVVATAVAVVVTAVAATAAAAVDMGVAVVVATAVDAEKSKRTNSDSMATCVLTRVSRTSYLTKNTNK